MGNWKYIEPHEGPKRSDHTNTELGNDPHPQLYDLSNDPGETQNLAEKVPGRARELQARLEELRRRSFSRP